MYAYKEKYRLDFSPAKDTEDIHKIIKNELDFPDYYGEKLGCFMGLPFRNGR